MLDSKTIQEIQNAPLEDRIHVIEQILQSLKQDIQSPLPKTERLFTVRKFGLGTEIHVDRDQMYTERLG